MSKESNELSRERGFPLDPEFKEEAKWKEVVPYIGAMCAGILFLVLMMHVSGLTILP